MPASNDAPGLESFRLRSAELGLLVALAAVTSCSVSELPANENSEAPGVGGTTMTPPGTGGAAPIDHPPGSGAAPPGVLCAGDLPQTSSATGAHQVTVNGAVSRGALPHFWENFGTGHLGLFVREEKNWGKTLREHVVDAVEHLGLKSVRQHGVFHDDVGIYSEVDGEPVFDFSVADRIFDFFHEHGIEPFVELASMPADLASDPTKSVMLYKYGTSPPKDYGRWQQLVYEFTKHYSERYGADVVARWPFEVWNEPNCCPNDFFTGTFDEYYQLYDASVAGVELANPAVRIGGPVTSQPSETTKVGGLGRGFLDHVQATGVRMDIFTYHSWLFLEGSVQGYFDGVKLLDEYGMSSPIAITEFGPTYQFNEDPQPQETRQGAAFVAQTFADISQRCARDGIRFPHSYYWWTISDIFEEGHYREDDPFMGGMGLISRESIKKPAYNAFAFLHQLGDEQVELTAAGAGGVGGLAARNADGGLQFIIYNAQSPGTGPVYQGVGDYYDEAPESTISVSVSGLDPTRPYDVTAYRVDEVKGNAFAAWERQGRPPMSAMTETQWQELRDVMVSPAEPIAQAACGPSFSQDFQLPSPGVLFVAFTPTG